MTGDLERARKTGEAWAQTYPRDASPHTILSGYVNKIPGRYEYAAAEAWKAVELDPDFAVGYYNVAVNNAYLERLDEAERVFQRAEARGHAARIRTGSTEAEEGEQEERAALWEAGAAVREALFGNARQAKERAKAALALSHDREVQYGTAFAFASAGDTFQAQTLADELERRFPKDSCVRFS